jgi:CBS domain-containing protein
VERPESPEAITQATPVGTVARLLRGTDPVTVHPDDTLRTIAAVSAVHPECGVLLVVDDDRVLVGQIRVTDLVDDIFRKIVPEEFLSEITGVANALDYAERIGARTAGDIMLPARSIRPEQTVREAFHQMHEGHLTGLAVVDESGRVEGYLDELELLLAWVEATGRSLLLEPRDPDEY